MFDVGQLVECVDAADRPGRGSLNGRLRKGAVYEVTGAGGEHPLLRNEGPCVTIAGVPNYPRHRGTGEIAGPDMGFLADRFRPLRDDRLDVFRKLVEPKPKLVHLEDELIDGILGMEGQANVRDVSREVGAQG